jgi:vancomycin resistance protein YoaR
MSTTSPELTRPFNGVRSLPWRTFALTFIITVLSVVVFGLVFVFALVSLNAGRIVPGTVVAGVPLGGLDRASAEVRLRDELPALSSGHITVQFGSFQGRIEYADIGRDYDINAMLDQALAIGHQGDVFAQAQQQIRIALNGASVGARVKWDEAALEQQLQTLALQVDTPPVDATIARDGAGFAVQPSTDGWSVDPSTAWQQALATVATLSPADAQVSVDPVSRPAAVTTAQAQLVVDRAERIAGSDLQITGAGASETISADTISGWIRLEPAGTGQWSVILERDPLNQAVAQMSASVYVAPVDATFKWQNGAAVAVPGSEGQELNVDATSTAVYDALMARADGPPVTTVQLSVAPVEPNFTTAQAIAIAPQVKMLSSWTTGFTPSDHNYFGANIVLPALVIDGTVVPAGSKFDFWATVGDLSQIPGIGPGGVIKHGRTDPQGALGGGICSCSTTLWNAAMRAGLQMGARANHAYYIDRYPTGLDATVYKSGSSVQNMTFINDTDYPIIIRGLKGSSKSACSGLRAEFGSVGYSQCVIFEIWGIPTGRTVTFSKPVITNLKVATDLMQWADTDPNGKPLSPGQLYRIEWPDDGFQSSVVRTVTDANGNIIHQETIDSKYVRVTGITLIGRSPTDPPAGTTYPNPNPFPPFKPPEAKGLN